MTDEDVALKILAIIICVCQERRYNFDLEEGTLFWSNGHDPWYETPPSLGRNSESKFTVFWFEQGLYLQEVAASVTIKQKATDAR